MLQRKACQFLWLIVYISIRFFSVQESTDSIKAIRSTSDHDIHDDDGDDECDNNQPYGFAYDVDDLPKIVMVHTLDRDPAKKARGSTVVDISPEGIFLPGVVLPAQVMMSSSRQSIADKRTRHSTTVCYLEPEAEGYRPKFLKPEASNDNSGRMYNETRKPVCPYGSDVETDRSVSDSSMDDRYMAWQQSTSFKRKKSIYIPDDKQIHENDTAKGIRFDEVNCHKTENIDQEVLCQKRRKSAQTYEIQKSKCPIRRNYQVEKDKRALIDDPVTENQETVSKSKTLMDRYVLPDSAADTVDRRYLADDIKIWKRRRYLAEYDYDQEHISEIDTTSHKDKISCHFSSNHISSERTRVESRRKSPPYYYLNQLNGSVSKRYSSLSDDSYPSNSTYWPHESDEDSCSNSDSSSLEETMLPVRYARRNKDIVYI